MSNRHDETFEEWAERTGGPLESNLTVRDWFAGMALQGLTSQAQDRDSSGPVTYAQWAYEMADAMLAQRNADDDAA